MNPIPYRSEYFGEKLHLDQNEKLAMFGVTHVLAVDGYSRKIVGMVTMPVKNAIAIYHTLLRPLLSTEGLWKQVRVDHGTEFALVATVQTHTGKGQRINGSVSTLYKHRIFVITGFPLSP